MEPRVKNITATTIPKYVYICRYENIFVEIYFIRTSGNAASLVAPPSEAAAGVPLI